MTKKIRLKEIEEGTRMTRKLLSLSGMGITFEPYLPYSIYLLAMSSVALCLLLYSMLYFRDHIEKVAVIIHHAILVFDIGASAVCGIMWKDRYDSIYNEPYWTYDYESKLMLKKTTEIKEEYGKNLSTMFRYSVYAMSYMLLNFILLAVIESFMNNDRRQLVFPCWFPFQLETTHAYLAVLLWEAIIMIHITTLVYATLNMSHYFYCHIKSELLLLKYAIRSIDERSNEMARNHGQYRETEKSYVNSQILKHSYIKCTRMCAEHHVDIIRYFNSGMMALDFLYFMIFISGLVVCTCTGFALISNNTALKVKFLGVMAIQLVYLYMTCWAAEAIAEESLLVSDTIYIMEWISLPKECHKILLIMLTRSTKPLLMKMLTGQRVDLAGYMSLIKASYSYFNMMLATTQ